MVMMWVVRETMMIGTIGILYPMVYWCGKRGLGSWIKKLATMVANDGCLQNWLAVTNSTTESGHRLPDIPNIPLLLSCRPRDFPTVDSR